MRKKEGGRGRKVRTTFEGTVRAGISCLLCSRMELLMDPKSQIRK